MRGQILIGLLALGLVELTTAQANPAMLAISKPIIVAQPVDLSGDGADFGRDYELGAKVYFDHVNNHGGIRGRRIIFRTADTHGKSDESLRVAQTMIDDHADILFGVVGDSVVEIIAKDQKRRAANIPLFGAVAGNSKLGMAEGVFYLRANLRQEISTTVKQLKNLGISSFGLASSNEGSDEAVAAIRALAADHGIRLVSQSRLSGTFGPTVAAQKIAAAQPQAVIVVADTFSAAQFFKRYRSLDPGAFLCAPSMVNLRTLISTIGPKAASGLIISQVVPNPAAILNITREHQRLMERYADEPSSPATLEGFIAARLLVRTLQKSPNLTSTGLRQALQAESRVDLGGYELDFSKAERPSEFVELSIINREGRLLR